MIDIDIIKRKYWSIGRVAKELDISVSKIRFWEDEKLLKSLRREHHSNPAWQTRFFDSKKYKRIQLILALRNFGIEIKLIRVALLKKYAVHLLKYLEEIK